jgi:glycosyltransferase involved in cell wall biosynthesis
MLRSIASGRVFTIVTPSFNQLDWLELCIASVADQQNVQMVEHIICDAGSVGIKDFQNRMMTRHPASSSYSLRFEVGPDNGMYDAINKGLRMGGGDIYSYLNCDEQLLPGALGAVDEYFLRHKGKEVVFGDTIMTNREGAALCYWRPYVPSLNHLAGATLNTLTCSTFFRRSVVDRGHLFDPQWKAVGDLIWVRGLLKARRPMGCLQKPLAAFTWLESNLGTSSTAADEFARSRQNADWLSRNFRRAVHAVRKLISGAYRYRQVAYEIFTLANPHGRSIHRHLGIGWTWPGAKSFSQKA